MPTSTWMGQLSDLPRLNDRIEKKGNITYGRTKTIIMVVRTHCVSLNWLFLPQDIAILILVLCDKFGAYCYGIVN